MFLLSKMRAKAEAFSKSFFMKMGERPHSLIAEGFQPFAAALFLLFERLNVLAAVAKKVGKGYKPVEKYRKLHFGRELGGFDAYFLCSHEYAPSKKTIHFCQLSH
jgi:hypothetical protein